MLRPFLQIPKSKDCPLYKQTIEKILDYAPKRYRKKALDEKDIYWNKEADLYYIKSDVTDRERRNAFVFCVAQAEWRNSTRFNHELDQQTDRFIQLSELREMLNG